jgi:hypothetical protein
MSQEFAVGDRVRIASLPPYIKTADPMPMLRPPQVVSVGEEGTVLARRPGGYWAIRFTNGSFLLDSEYLELATSQPHTATTAAEDGSEAPEDF